MAIFGVVITSNLTSSHLEKYFQTNYHQERFKIIIILYAGEDNIV